MAGSDGRRESAGLWRHQRTAAERLRKELLGSDGSLSHPYFAALRTEFRSARRRVDIDGLISRCARADVIYVGDFHANPSCQRFAAQLLERLAKRGLRVALGVEFVYTRQQETLDRRQSNEIDDPAFLRRIHYREEWGYPWEGFKDLLDRARRLGVAVHALDRPPRGGFDGLAGRDRHAAQRITALLGRRPRVRLIVLFGESHIARAHLPALVTRRSAPSRKRLDSVRIFQDPDAVYWSILRDGRPIPEAVELRDGAYAVFHTSPLRKYEAYRQVLDRWKGDVPPEEEVDLTPAVHHLIRVLLGWLGLRAGRRILHRSGWDEELEDAFPEVYAGPEAASLLPAILREYGRTPAEIGEAQALLRSRGAVYEPRSNTMFLSRYLPSRAAGESARFLRAALSGRLFHPGDDSDADPAHRAYGAAYNEALAYLGARVVDPAADAAGVDAEILALDPSAGGSNPPAHRGFRLSWLARHEQFEKESRSAVPPARLLSPLRRSRLVRRLLSRDLGQRLGRVLFERARTGELSSRGVRFLFARPLPPADAPRVVCSLLRAR